MGRIILLVLLLGFSFLGMADSWYLTETAAKGEETFCVFGEEQGGCDTVAQSPYSHLFGIPLSVYGVLFYALVMVITAAALTLRVKTAPLALVLVGGAGVVASVIFIGIQVFLIKALCAYCMVSAGISLAIFIVAWILFAGRKETLVVPPHHP